MSDTRIIERFEDMSPLGRLQLLFQSDGDVIVHVIPDPEHQWHASHSVEFCSVGAGGGRSPHTIKALRALGEAIAADNTATPIRRDPEVGRGMSARAVSPTGFAARRELAEVREDVRRRLWRLTPAERDTVIAEMAVASLAARQGVPVRNWRILDDRTPTEETGPMVVLDDDGSIEP